MKNEQGYTTTELVVAILIVTISIGALTLYFLAGAALWKYITG